MIRDPNVLRADGIPECFGNYLEGHYVCENKCSRPLTCNRETEEEEKRREGKQFKRSDNRPSCFGKLYSPFSDECTLLCNEAHDCCEVTDESDNRFSRTTYRAPLKNEKSLPMYQSYRPAQTTYTQATSPIQQYVVDERTNQYIKQKYGIALRTDPTVPGQFEGEPWYERFIKEVLKYAGYYALQLLAAVISNARWAPSIEKSK